MMSVFSALIIVVIWISLFMRSKISLSPTRFSSSNKTGEELWEIIYHISSTDAFNKCFRETKGPLGAKIDLHCTRVHSSVCECEKECLHSISRPLEIQRACCNFPILSPFFSKYVRSRLSEPWKVSCNQELGLKRNQLGDMELPFGSFRTVSREGTFCSSLDSKSTLNQG